MRRSLTDLMAPSQVLIPAVYNTDQNSSEIDMQGNSSLMFLFNVGNSADTLSGTNKIELEIQHSDTSGQDFAAVADADVQDTVTGTNPGTVAQINAPAEDSLVVKGSYIGNKRYVRAVLNFEGTHSTGTPIGIVALEGHLDKMPA